MSKATYEPFGESVPSVHPHDQPRSAGGWMLRVGNGVFWAMVAAIVIARAAYFHPEVAFRFDAAVAYLHNGLAGLWS